MNIVNFTGSMSFEEFHSIKLEEYHIDKTLDVVIRVIRIFAWTVLLIGFSINIWIIYAMIFAYK
jgi:hypothetical protein